MVQRPRVFFGPKYGQLENIKELENIIRKYNLENNGQGNQDQDCDSYNSCSCSPISSPTTVTVHTKTSLSQINKSLEYNPQSD